MSAINHPAANEERTHLRGTLGVIAGESETAQAEQLINYDKMIEARKYDLDAVPLREMLYARSEFIVKNLGLAQRKPYFTRVDFRESGTSNKQVYYIGKYGVTHSTTLDIEVVDWRSPVANLYYSGQLGPMHYVCPDGEVRGELLLKRQFGIETGELTSIFDTDVVSQDAYLQSVLGAVSHDKLREVVTTIQAEQNFVIRHKPDRPLIVQGVAGSGKTTIALHRIAYLLYAYQDRLTPDQMMIIAPNPLFLDYISGVLPDLGVDRVKQTTYALFMTSILGKALPKVNTADRLDELLDMDDDARARITRILRAKGAIALTRYIDSFMYDFERTFAEHGDIIYGPVTILSREQVRRFFLEDVKPFPLARRLNEFGKLLKRRVAQAQADIAKYMTELCAQKVEKIKAREPDSPERRAKFSKLYTQRNEQIAQAKTRAPGFVKDTLASFPELTPISVYRAFWAALLNGELDIERTEAALLRDAHTAATASAQRASEQRNGPANAGFGQHVSAQPAFSPRRDGHFRGMKHEPGKPAVTTEPRSPAAARWQKPTEVESVGALNTTDIESAAELKAARAYKESILHSIKPSLSLEAQASTKRQPDAADARIPLEPERDTQPDPYAISDELADALIEAAAYTLEHTSTKSVEPEDIAPLCLLTARLTELPRVDVRHTVIDEAQDFSPLEFLTLRRLIGNDSFTIVGDLMQGVHAYRGINTWAELAHGIFTGEATMHDLVVSYRNTIEIMEAALHVAETQPVPGQKRAQPVLRHGEPPKLIRFGSVAEQVGIVESLIREYKRDGFGTIALIGRNAAGIKQVVGKLAKDLDVKIMDVQKPSFTGGVLAAPASSIKGLEFDCVIMLDVGPEAFPVGALHARLLYVCLTRPLHRLACLEHIHGTGLESFGDII